MQAMPILLIRPRDQSEALAETLRAAGAGRIVIAPLIAIVPGDSLPDVAGGALLTSGNAVRAWVALGGRRGLPAWVVGPGTAAAARAAGFDVRGVVPDAAALTDRVPRDAPPLVHLRGAVQRGDLAGTLRARGLAAGDAVIYRQDALPLSPEARSLLAEGPALVPLYSPRTAAILRAECPGELRAHLRVVALSDAVAAESPVPPCGIAETPDGSAMLRTILANLGASPVEGRGRSV
ncbi:uroporphyrinogen-III synthase [uncultured Jannaschia sp.]|uniref:uroporphyrinogen-III synthase n=1 Tax=uncultured Jannaschia sp. TaxID=293347 RepID=UPI00262FA29D|nr:uroporphyrinogen-III synthase [uncultured Jannaschia sp.]